jgi:hypothetical protein
VAALVEILGLVAAVLAELPMRVAPVARSAALQEIRRAELPQAEQLAKAEAAAARAG